ncbi:MAG: hypothetical protein M3544_02095, partial [Pseudomonadota bacterium]|nr:hypothetical protein [Pseudomonadota bacterium]
MSKRRPSKTALRRRSRPERRDTAPGDYRSESLRELERAGAPTTALELARRLAIKPRERRAFNAGLAELERAGEVVQN